MKKEYSLAVAVSAMAIVALLVTGCSHPSAPVAMAPPVSGGQGQGQGQVYNWTDVPTGQQVPIARAAFDQGGYQLYAQSGETIAVPFANQNMYVMKFGQTSGGEYFVNDGTVPTLYLPPGAGIENASAQGARWYPFPQNYAYTQPVYMGLAPTWSAFTGMGWYPGMAYYGGYYGYHPYGMGFGFMPMVGLHFLIGGHPYYGWGGYHSYYVSHPAPYHTRTVYNYHSAGSGSGFGSRRSFGSSSFGSSRRTFGSSSFGGSSAARSSGSFGSGRSGFGGSFGSRPSGGSSFGSRPSGGSSFGGGSFGSRPSGGSSFGGGSFGSRPSGGSSFGGGSFGGGGRSFGGGRRR